MTNDFDDLVSAYVDGQVSPDEAALVESDPSLLAEVEALRSLSGRLSSELPVAPPGQRARHLRAALAAFDEAYGTGGPVPADSAPGPGAVTDLAGRRPSQEAPSRPVLQEHGPIDELGDRRARRQQRQGLPSWLGAAAAAVLVVGGLGWALRSVDGLGGGDDADESASFAADETSEASDDAFDSDEETGADGSAAQEAVAAEAAPANGEADTTERAEGSADEAEESSDDEAVDDTEDGGADEADDAGATSGQGFFPAEDIEAVREPFDGPPDPAVVELLASGPLFEAELSACAGDIVPPAGGELVGFHPISVDGADGEILVFRGPDGPSTEVLVVGAEPGQSCQPLG